jgi:hypothetical protein
VWKPDNQPIRLSLSAEGAENPMGGGGGLIDVYVDEVCRRCFGGSLKRSGSS